MYDMGACPLFFSDVSQTIISAGLGNKKTAAAPTKSDSLAARLASRIVPAEAPWLCVTVFRRLCSEQRAYSLTIIKARTAFASRAGLSCYIMGRSNAVLGHANCAPA
jgi:hypothetical protein